MAIDWMGGSAAEWAQWSTTTARLADFQPLLPAEEEVIARLKSGSFDRLGDGSRPERAQPGRVIRAAILRFLVLGGEEGYRPHEKGIRIAGAWITDVLDLEACRVFRDIGLNDCHFEATPVLRSAIINRLFLDGSSLPGLLADRLEARGGVYLRGAQVDGPISIAESRLGGNLECDGVTIRTLQGYALNAQGMEVRNILARGAKMRGGINMLGAELAADFDCAGAEVTGTDGIAIQANESQVRGSAILRSGRFEGEVRLVASVVAGDMDCTGAIVKNRNGGIALDMSRSVVRGAFFLRDGAEIGGTLSMTGASLGTIHDEASCWPKKGDLLLNRCLYNAFIEGPVDAKSRLDWLARQTPTRWGEDFWPQPYEQLASVFRQMGHGEDARAVLIVKEHLQRRARRLRAKNTAYSDPPRTA